MDLIDLLLDTASYLDSHHDAEAVRLRCRLRDRAERLFVESCLPEFAAAVPLADALPMAMADQRPAVEPLKVYGTRPSLLKVDERATRENGGHVVMVRQRAVGSDTWDVLEVLGGEG